MQAKATQVTWDDELAGKMAETRELEDAGRKVYFLWLIKTQYL
jgi:hypothetical protein